MSDLTERDRVAKQLREAAGWSRRGFLKTGLILGGATLIGSKVMPSWAQTPPVCPAIVEVYPTSPFILNPFNDPLPIPPVYRPSNPATWGGPLPGAGHGQQDSTGHSTHQIWPTALGMPNPVCYRIKLEVGEHRLTTSLVRPIDSAGNFVVRPGTTDNGPQQLPASTIYGFNGSFPGPMINAVYGRPNLIRFENHLDENPLNLDRQNFGSPEWAFLTHLHNGHTAPESDGNPFHTHEAYRPNQWVDNLYLNYPAGGDPREMQSFCWFHDHTHGHTGANVYKGMVGLYPLYDSANNGDETNPRGLRLPGRRRNNSDGTFSVDYDIPLALYDCCLDDGVTPHADMHTAADACGDMHPEWWGKTYFKHFPDHGFVSDIFTVNGKAYPVLEVKRRKYRLRFLGASIARCYELAFMSSTSGPEARPGTQGQYQLPDGQQCMRTVQIANEGGLLSNSITRNSFEIWPAKRKEVIIDFTNYMDGTPTHKGDVIYLTNVLEMQDGRKPDFKDGVPLNSRAYKVPMMKIVIGDDPPSNEPDLSIIPKRLREAPILPSPTQLDALPHKTFELKKGGPDDENMWVIRVNGGPALTFDHMRCDAAVRKGTAEVWTITNGGGGWTHPMHLHQEEHRVIGRTNGRLEGPQADDIGKEDVIALDPGESVTIYRKFRTFTGNYVAHCHNLAHEDHAMMFSWKIDP